MESSAIPRALDALLTMANEATASGGDLEGWLVHDGPLKAAPSDKKILIIGGKDISDEAAVEGHQEWATIPGRERNEEFSILCTAIAWSGSTDWKPLRDLAFTGVAAVERLIRPGVTGSDVTLNGTVRFAGVAGPTIYDPIHTEKGAVVRVYFQVECRERLS